MIHGFLQRTYWAKGRSREHVVRTVDSSIPFGLFDGEDQIGFARVVTDYVVVAFLADVFVHEDYRGKGLGTWLAEVATSHPELRHVGRWLLATRDAHTLYSRFGFGEPDVGVLMERVHKDTWSR